MALGQTFLHLSNNFFQLHSFPLESLGDLEYVFDLADDFINKNLLEISKDYIQAFSFEKVSFKLSSLFLFIIR